MLNRIPPILCLVTDRRRLCVGCDDAAIGRCVIAQVREAVDAGIDLVQVRERDLDAGRLADLVAEAVGVARGSATRIVVNDRLDVALAAGAAGVHLRADSISPAAARRLTPEGFLIGQSVHSESDARSIAGDVDYLIAGTVFATTSKPDDAPRLGEAGLAAIVRVARAPVLAIGGITLEVVPRVASAGAAGLAAIGLFLGESRPCRCMPLGRIAAAARARFDSLKTAP